MEVPEEQTGLSNVEARRRLEVSGPNLLAPRTKRASLWSSARRAATDPMAVMLAAATPTYALLGDRFDAVVTALALLPVVGIGLLLEGRAERALERLSELTAPTARAFRDGALVTLPAAELVPGDFVVITDGDVTPADVLLLRGTELAVDESALTGESLPVEKSFCSGSGEPQRSERVFAGTTVVTGRAVARVTETGSRTEYGRIGALVSAAVQTRTPLQKSVDALFGRLAVAAVAVCVFVTAAQLSYGHRLGEAVISGISLAVAAIPEEFPMVFVLFLTLGAWRLSKQNALVRRLAGVEALGSTTVICTDKTGTLSLGRMEVGAIATIDDGIENVVTSKPVTPPSRRLLEAAVLASEPTPFDEIERAIVREAVATGIDVEGLHAGNLAVDYAFDPRRKYVTHVWYSEGRFRVCAKGALEGMLDVTRAPSALRESANRFNSDLAQRGLRVIAVAEGVIPEKTGERASDEQTLELLGLVAFEDPLRPGVLEALRACRDAHIRVVMVTGDHPLTAHAIADALGIPHDDASPVVTGDEVDRMDDDAFAAAARNAALFCRMRPEQKHRLVKSLQSAGEVVAVTGDGINDAPALRQADVGVAMGQRGTAVAREAAALVLLDDNFATIVFAIREGRRIFDNLQRSFAYLIAFHVPVVLLALILPLVNAPLLLTPITLVLLELVVHPTVSLVFDGDPPQPELMRRTPRPKDQPLIDRTQAFWPALRGLSLTLGVLLLYLFLLRGTGEERLARGVAFLGLVIGDVLLVFTERSPDAPLWNASYAGNRALPVVAGLTLAGAAAFVFIPPLAAAMHVAPPSLEQIGLAGLVAIGSVLWTEPFKRRRQGPESRATRAEKPATTSP